MRNALILFSLAIAVFLGGCVSTGSQFLPSDTITFLTTDYRFKEVMKSNDDVKGWDKIFLNFSKVPISQNEAFLRIWKSNACLGVKISILKFCSHLL